MTDTDKTPAERAAEVEAERIANDVYDKVLSCSPFQAAGTEIPFAP